MKNILFSFAVHNHQPIGNFDSVIKEAYQNSYRPFLDVLRRHRDVKFTQHWTGTLLEWLRKHHPDFIEEMKDLVHRGQLELLTGSYYEAILAIIPEEDRIGQIRKLSDMIHRLFDYVPRGMWLAERVWEQQLVPAIARAGVEFLVVDDTHFRSTGLGDEQLLGYYVTEDQGVMLKVLPIDKTLRYTIPFRAVAETRHYLQGVASERGDRVVIHADDGEKFGVWPHTYDAVFKQHWLEDFCAFLHENKAWVRTVHLGEVTDSMPPQGRVYLPSASYTEMMKWVLNPTAFFSLDRFEQRLSADGMMDEQAMFVRGGFWRNFLAKYPEANHIHKKMLRVAARLRRVADAQKIPRRIYDFLWAGQCNDPYWHGVFGGLYLPNLRYPVYHNLLKAETGLDELEGMDGVRVERTDFDCDGQDEVLVESNILNIYVKPGHGGGIVELDYKPLAINLLDIMSRREEGHHRKLIAARAGNPEGQDHPVMKEEGLERHLHFDWYRHASSLDHFLSETTSLEEFRQCTYLEEGDFVNQPFDAGVTKTGNAVTVTLERDGAIWRSGKRHRIAIRKMLRYVSGESGYTISYRLNNLEKAPVRLRFATEFNVGLMAGDAEDRFYDIEGRPLADRRLRSVGVEKDVRNLRLVDEWLNLETGFELSSPATLWRCPIETVSLSEAGFERIYQSSIILPVWEFVLGDMFEVVVSQTVTVARPKGKGQSA
jgi:alpha-amylase